ncbi:hypothetical protein CC86DRAFT_81187 [Ophiobolus disseminans]|uniref:Ubiquitin-like domain-containing protein n=1 Tax=Ophiobolus disseminans TaxID=1469910 RepID=A0A6A6ZPH1_9PLEO|nr:hypothetical protein CC86DRAFT_81187 [Ophiobolus disseminans]
MVPAFGFSVGDFIAAAGLIAKVVKALKDKSGAASEYQHVQIELEALDRTLKHLEALKPNESNVAHVNAIRGMALTCRMPLQEFLEKIEKFERTMGTFSIAGARSAFGRKSQWAVFMTGEVAKLRTSVGAKVLSINLLLVTHTSESVSRVEAQAHKSHATLLASILDIRSQAASANQTLQTTQSIVNDISKGQKRQVRYMKRTMKDAGETLRTVSKTTTSTNHAVMSFRGLGIQLFQLVQNLPKQVRDTLEQVLISNLEMYAMLRSIQTTVSRSPGYGSEDTFQFEDVLGRAHLLPYQYFRHREIFMAFLQTEFRGLPGEQQVFHGKYHVLDIRRNGIPVTKADWVMTVFPGAKLAMSVLGNDRILGSDACQRLSCTGRLVWHPRQVFGTW